MPINNALFVKNTDRRMIDVTVQVNHALRKDIDNTARSGYYRCAIILACTIVEGLLYRIVDKHLATTGGMMKVSTRCKKPHSLPSSFSSQRLAICVLEIENIPLSDETKFNDLIDYSHRFGIISKKEKKEIDKVRRLRNKIHIQSINDNDRGYTKKKLDQIFNVINFLEPKYP
jgi:hypothetical protein